MRWQHDADLLEQQRRRISNFRLAAGGALIAAALYWVFTTELWAVPAAVVAGILLALLVRQYRRLTVDWMRASTLALVNRYGVARQRRDWNSLPDPHAVTVATTHPYAADLDIVGKASLLQLLDTTGTTMGGERLASWLLQPAAPDEIPPRQDAVRELSADLDWLQELQQRSLLGEIDDDTTTKFLEWTRTPGSRLPVLTWLARLSVLASLVIFGLAIARVIDSGWLALPFMANLLLATALHRKVGRQMDAAMEHGSAIRAYAGLLALLDGKQRQAPLLQEIDAPLQTDGVAASEAAEQLAKILSFGVPRGSLQSYVLQLACAWDIHFYDRLERWRETYGEHVPRWLEAIGWYEALGAFANLAYDNPDWAYPDVSPDNDRIAGKQLGHPLIPGLAARFQRRHAGTAGKLSLCHRLQYVRQEHIAAIDRRGHSARQRRRSRLRGSALLATDLALDQRAHRRFAGNGRFLLHGRALATKTNRGRVHYPASGRPHHLLPARRDSFGYEHRRTADRGPANYLVAHRAGRDWRGFDARSRPAGWKRARWTGGGSPSG